MAPEPDERSPEPIEVPYTELSPEALLGVIESFVLREGTEYGAREFTLEQKVAHVRAQLERHEVQILFDPATQSINLVPALRSRGRDG